MKDVLLSLASTKAVHVRWPTALDGEPLPTSELEEPQTCTHPCEGKPCLAFVGDGHKGTCSFGFGFRQALVAGVQVVTYGIAPDPLPKKLSNYQRQLLRGRHVPAKEHLAWIEAITALARIAADLQKGSALSAMQSLHDAFRLVREISTLADELVRARQTEDRDAPPLELSLFKAAELLQVQFDRTEILFNPASAGVGTRSSHLYRLVDKYVRILRLSEAKRRNKRIRLQGSSVAVYWTYDSLPVLVYALLENAVKYAQTQDVIVTVGDDVSGTTFSVESDGPLIERTEIRAIFELGYRGRWARRLNSEGMGVGLYLAKVVCDAHRYVINVRSDPLNYERDGAPIAHNIFSVRVFSVGAN